MRVPKRFAPKFRLEALEDRCVPATFVVTNLDDSGAGSFRQAIIDANTSVGADEIEFNVAGTIVLASDLPPIIGEVIINGASAPGFTNAPVVQLDANGFAAIAFASGSGNSTLRSLSIGNASGSGVSVSVPDVTIAGNYIGLAPDGSTPTPNAGNGIDLAPLAIRGIIGTPDPLDRNVVSANAGHGIVINGGFENKISANFIGTDATGALDRGNGGNGVLVTNAASTNLIGGVTPSAEKFTVIAPDGNVISGNGGSGILITLGSVTNTVAANFIGTNLAGDAAVPNDGDGIAITKGANGNSILGTFINEIPFIFMNLVSGNAGNGLRISDSNGTIVQANVFGLSADNDNKLPNGANGALIEGSSNATTFGGVIPLGNVTSGNALHGVAVTDTVSNFTAFNSFSGTGAFSLNDQLGNTLDGFNITATGGNNVVRTTIASGNGSDGIEISGAATGVSIIQVLAGTNTDGTSILANGEHGIRIGGTASNNTIGGVQLEFSVAPHNVLSGNGGYGVAVVDSAANNTINFSYIGSSSAATAPLPNGLGGILLDAGTSNTTVGSVNPLLYTFITGNSGPGITVNSSGNRIIGTGIGITKFNTAMANSGDGILIGSGSNNAIGGDRIGEPNTIANNTGNGVNILAGSGNSIRETAFFNNGLRGIAEAAGANANIGVPFVAGALLFDDGLQVTGAVVGAVSSTYTVEIFADTTADAADAEGRTFLGRTTVRTDAAGNARFRFTAATPAASSTFITATATDSGGNTSEFSAARRITAALVNIPSGSVDGGTLTLFPGFDGEIRVVTADFNGDGIPDLAAATGPGSLSLVKILDGASGEELFSITPFGDFTGGLFITAGDLDGDGKAELAITAGFFGGPRVRIFQGGTFTQINDFFGIDDVNFRGGTNAALADVNGDGKADLAVAAGAGGGPRVAVYDGTTLANAAPLRFRADFFAFDASLRAGVYVAAGDITGDGKADLVFTSGLGGGPQVRVLDGAKYLVATVNPDGTIVDADAISFFARSASDRNGLRVNVRDLDGDGLLDITTRADNGTGHDAVSFLASALNAGIVDPKLHFDSAFGDFSNPIFVGS